MAFVRYGGQQVAHPTAFLSLRCAKMPSPYKTLPLFIGLKPHCAIHIGTYLVELCYVFRGGVRCFGVCGFYVVQRPKDTLRVVIYAYVIKFSFFADACIIIAHFLFSVVY